MSRSVLLLRAVNVGGRNRVPMAELRALLAARPGFGEVSTYLASGNVVVDDPADPAGAAEEVRALLDAELGVDTPVVVRSHAELVAAAAANPFPDGAEKLVHAVFPVAEPSVGTIEELMPRLRHTERIAVVGRELWIDYGDGVAGTRLTGVLIDRALGCPATARNLRTVRRLAELTG